MFGSFGEKYYLCTEPNFFIMKYRAKCTNWVESLQKWYPEIPVLSDVSGDYWAELDNEDAAEAVEKINKMVGELWKQK